MAKKKQSKQAQQLSPENYIRQKARKLPIYECLVNAGWEVSKMASVVVARVHASGNITAGFFMVDLYCLGVKNTTYSFNSSPVEYEEQIEKMMHLDINKISYELAHNIVYAGLDYASELGLNPHKDFTSLTRFILEEDTEDVELIDIECGRNGKPFYMQGQYDSEQMAKRVLAQLERSVGKGNYDFSLETQTDENEDKYDDDDFEVEKDEFSDLTYEQKKVLFLQLLKSLEIDSEAERKKLSDLLISTFKGLVDSDLVDDLYDYYKDILDISILPVEEVPYELWGVMPGELTVTDEITNLFVGAYNLVNEDTKQASKQVKRLKKIVGDIPGVRLLELMMLQKEGKESARIQMILNSQTTFPDYPVFKLQSLRIRDEVLFIPDKVQDTIPGIQDLFENRTSLHEIEFMNYILALIALIDYEANAEKLEALLWAIEELELPDTLDATVYTEIMAVKFKLVIAYFS